MVLKSNTQKCIGTHSDQIKITDKQINFLSPSEEWTHFQNDSYHTRNYYYCENTGFVGFV